MLGTAASCTARQKVAHREQESVVGREGPLQTHRPFLSGTWAFAAVTCRGLTCRASFTANISSLTGSLRGEWPEGGAPAPQFLTPQPAPAQVVSGLRPLVTLGGFTRRENRPHHLRVTLESVGVSLSLPILSLWKAPRE